MTAPKKTKKTPRKIAAQFNDAFDAVESTNEPQPVEVITDDEDYILYPPIASVSNVEKAKEILMEKIEAQVVEKEELKEVEQQEKVEPAKNYDAETIDLLIDAVRYLHKKAKHKILAKDTPLIEKRLARALLLKDQLLKGKNV